MPTRLTAAKPRTKKPYDTGPPGPMKNPVEKPLPVPKKKAAKGKSFEKPTAPKPPWRPSTPKKR